MKKLENLTYTSHNWKLLNNSPTKLKEFKSMNPLSTSLQNENDLPQYSYLNENYEKNCMIPYADESDESIYDLDTEMDVDILIVDDVINYD